MLVSTMKTSSVLWQTSPAATEMEQVMVDWLRQALGIDDGFAGNTGQRIVSNTLRYSPCGSERLALRVTRWIVEQGPDSHLLFGSGAFLH